MSFVQIAIFCVLSVWVRCSKTLPQDFSSCKVENAHFQYCLNKAIEDGVKLLANGYPNYKLPPLDPFKLPSLKIGAGSGPVKLEQIYDNVVISGFADIKVNNSRLDLERNTLTFDAFNPHIQQKAHYNVNGKIMMLPVYGTGPSTIVLENTISQNLIEFKRVDRGNSSFMIPYSYTVDLKPGHAQYHFDNLFNGNKLLGDNINNVINQEWYAIFQDVGRWYAQAYSRIFLDYAKAIYENNPINEVFLE